MLTRQGVRNLDSLPAKKNTRKLELPPDACLHSKEMRKEREDESGWDCTGCGIACEEVVQAFRFH